MPVNFHIKKGLDIKLQGESDKILKNAPHSDIYSIVPPDFHRITPKLLKKQGEKVKAGTPIFYSKDNNEIMFCSPVSGEIQEIVRGAKRKILEILIKYDKEGVAETKELLDLKSADEKAVKAYLLAGGCWPYIKQRPYDIIANPDEKPKAIFISGINSAPLSTEIDYSLKDKAEMLQAAVDALSILCKNINITIPKDENSIFENIKNATIHKASGVHPVGNISTQIAKIDPINKGEKIWTIAAEDLSIIGNLILTGQFVPEKNIAVAGSEVKRPHYITVTQGAKISDILEVCGLSDNEEQKRIILGDVLTGKTSNIDSYLGFYTNQITVIPEGADYDFLGWQLPRFNKFSVLRANMFSFLTPKKAYSLNANMNGEHRAFALTGQFEKVFPLDIYPLQLIKACMANDIDEMEALGIYEVAPEDFALTEFIDVSKNEHQKLLRESLDMMIEEVG